MVAIAVIGREESEPRDRYGEGSIKSHSQIFLHTSDVKQDMPFDLHGYISEAGIMLKPSHRHSGSK